MQRELNPLEFTGSQFLTFYFLLSVFAIAVASLLRRALRLPANQPPDSPVSLDVYEAAYLAAGESRAVDTVVAGFIQKEWVTVQADALVWQSPRADFSHPLESAVAQAILVDGAPEAVRSRWGDRLLRELQEPIAKTTRERADPQLPWAFALLGMAVLPDEGFGDWKKLLKPLPQDDSHPVAYGEIEGSSGGDSGCGGCGGCSSDGS